MASDLLMKQVRTPEALTADLIEQKVKSDILKGFGGLPVPARVAGELGGGDVQSQFPAERPTIQSMLSGLGYTGALVRGLLAGEGAPKVDGEWVSGRDLLTKYFGAPENKHKGFSLSQILKDPVETALDTAGFATEMVTDPLAYVGFGMLTPAGEAARQAGKLPSFWKQFGTKSHGMPLRTAVGFAKSPTGPIVGSVSESLDKAVSKVGEKTAKAGTETFEKIVPDDLRGWAATVFRKAGMPGNRTLRRIQGLTNEAEIDATQRASAQMLDFRQRMYAKGLWDEDGLVAIENALENSELRRNPNTASEILEIVEQAKILTDDVGAESKHLGTLQYDYGDSALAQYPEFFFRPGVTVKDFQNYRARTQTNVANKRTGMALIEQFNPANIPTPDEMARHDIFGRGIHGGVPRINEIAKLERSFDRDGSLRAMFDAAQAGDQKAAVNFKKAMIEKMDGVAEDIAIRDPNGRLPYLNLQTGKMEYFWDDELNRVLEGMSTDGSAAGINARSRSTPAVTVDSKGGIRFKLKNKDREITATLGNIRKSFGKGKWKDVDKEAIFSGRTPIELDEGRFFVDQHARDTVGLTRNGEEIVPLVHNNRNRRERFAQVMLDNPEVVEKGVYSNDVVHDLHNYLDRKATRNAAVRGVYAALGEAYQLPNKVGDGKSVLDIVRSLNVNDKVGVQRVYENIFGEEMLQKLKSTRKGITADNIEALETIIPDIRSRTTKEIEEAGGNYMKRLMGWAKESRLDRSITDDLALVAPVFGADTETLFLNLMNSYGRLWKAATLAWPSKHFRDEISNIHRNIEAGFIGADAKAVQTVKRAHNIYLGRGDRALRDPNNLAHEHIAGELRNMGLDPARATDEEYTKAFKVLYAKHRGSDMTMREELRVGDSLEGMSGLRTIQRAIPGYEEAASTGQLLKDIGKGNIGGVERKPIEGKPWSTLFTNPSDTELPIMGKWLRMNDAVGDYTDNHGRLIGFLGQLENGVDPKTAMERLQGALINYDPRKLNPFERNVMKKLIPFYSFWRQNLLWTGGQLLQRPGGRVGQLLKLYQNKDVQTDPSIPAWMREAVAVPYQNDDDSIKSFVTGFGLMTEDAIGTLSGAGEMFRSPGLGARQLGSELLQRSNPLPKSALEWVTGVSTFQTTDEGGRPLVEMDPPIGRLISNISERTGIGEVDTPIGLVPTGMEHMINALPGVSRVLNAANKALDTRDIPASHRALNILTGMKISNVDQQQQAKNEIESLRKMLRDFRPVTYDLPFTFINKGRLEGLPPEEQERVQSMMRLLKQVQERRKRLRSED